MSAAAAVRCRWCERTRAEHIDWRASDVEPPPSVCQGLKNRFLPHGSAPALNGQREYEVHRVSLLLCEGCLLGLGNECHTPACALCRHDSPGPMPLMIELYEVVHRGE
jgi:hypothetical protein